MTADDAAFMQHIYLLGLNFDSDALEQLDVMGVSMIPRLVECLHSEQWEIRVGAAWGLGHFKQLAAVAIDDLVRLLSDPKAIVVHRAAWALARIGAEAERAFSALTRILGHEELSVRNTACLALNCISSERVYSRFKPTLEKALTDRSLQVRRVAAGALIRLGLNNPPMIRETVNMYVASARGSELDDSIGEAWHYVELTEENGRLVLKELIRIIMEGESPEKANAIYGLAKVGDFVNCSPVLERHLSDSSAEVKTAAEWALKCLTRSCNRVI